MRTKLVAVLAFGASLGLAQPVSAGPVKHWAALPGREIRTIQLRDTEIAQRPLIAVVAARDGWVYVRAGDGLYRVLGTDGVSSAVASFDWCDSRNAALVVPYATPGFACVAKNTIIEIANGTQFRRPLPIPQWRAPDGDLYRYDYPFVTWIERTPGGRWWFAYGYAGGLGYADPDGTTYLRHVIGMPRPYAAAVLGEDVFLGGNGCAVTRVRGFRVRGSEWLCGHFGVPRFVRSGEALWVLAGSAVERRLAGGTVRRWFLGVEITDAAYDARTRTAYLLGADRDGRNHLVTIGPDDVPHDTRLPMTGGSTIAVDARRRIWIGVPLLHALAVIAPPGEWG
ncbi:MAG TPA: hypothetical protein VHS78_07160 [Candidatus Elarobacter sp.]|jgi:hypothetical protein|nr:hypothetical protein [Candidatus Elarobacter sp.]